MDPFLLLATAAVGAVAGLLAGLLGVGGGLVIVPALVWVYARQGFPESLLMQAALATSLASILFTGLSAVRAHHARGAVRWDLVGMLAPTLMLGAFAGSHVAHRMTSDLLMMLFGTFAAVIGLQMLLGRAAPQDTGLPAAPARQVGKAVHLAVGLLIGVASAFFGIGGGSLTVPYLSAVGVRMQQAVATSSACGIPIAVAGSIGFILAGWSRADLPAGSAGYVHLPSLVAIVMASVPAARLGANLAHRLPAATLRRVFAVLLLLVATEFLLK